MMTLLWHDIKAGDPVLMSSSQFLCHRPERLCFQLFTFSDEAYFYVSVRFFDIFSDLNSVGGRRLASLAGLIFASKKSFGQYLLGRDFLLPFPGGKFASEMHEMASGSCQSRWYLPKNLIAKSCKKVHSSSPSELEEFRKKTTISIAHRQMVVAKKLAQITACQRSSESSAETFIVKHAHREQNAAEYAGIGGGKC
jgi:hypothetical protein